MNQYFQNQPSTLNYFLNLKDQQQQHFIYELVFSKKPINTKNNLQH